MKNCFLIVNCNDYKSTAHLIENIISYTCLDHILIVDNNSNNEEKELLKTLENSRIEIMYNEENLGYSKAINKGSKYLIDKFGECNLIISNSDIVIMSEEDLNRMIELLNNELIGLIGPQILEKGIISRGVKNISPKMDSLLNIPILRNFYIDKIYYEDEHYENEISTVDAINGCFFLISSDTLKKVNYMDENIFLYYEDYVLSKKVKNLGLLVVVYNKVKIKHLYAGTVSKITNDISKHKMFSKSQFYYHTTYNNANMFERFLLKITSRLGIEAKRLNNKKR